MVCTLFLVSRRTQCPPVRHHNIVSPFMVRCGSLTSVHVEPLYVFDVMCHPAGEKGIVPEGKEGAGRPYHFKGRPFYRIIDAFIDQAGALQTAGGVGHLLSEHILGLGHMLWIGGVGGCCQAALRCEASPGLKWCRGRASGTQPGTQLCPHAH